MKKQYWNKFKREQFPEIKDWTLDYNEYRHAPNAGKLPMKYYLFFTPASYLIASYGTNIMTFLMFGAGAIYLAFGDLWILSFLLGFIALNGLYAFIKNVKQHDIIKNTTFYDIWFRENVTFKKE